MDNIAFFIPLLYILLGIGATLLCIRLLKIKVYDFEERPHFKAGDLTSTEKSKLVIEKVNVPREKEADATINPPETARLLIEQAIDDERVRIKDALHDFTIQQVVAIRLQLEEILLFQDNERAKANTQHVINELGKTIDSLRYLIYNLTLPVFENKTLQQLIGELKLTNNRFLRLTVYSHEIAAENIFELTNDQKRELIFIIQESLQNSIKYSDGAQFHIWLDWTNGLKLITEDVGFGLRHMRQLGNGILSMKARAESIGATFNIDPYKTQGVTITVTLPATEAHSDGHSL